MKVITTALKEHGAYAPDVGAATRHPRMGAAQQPEVAVRELTENKRLIEKRQQKRYPRGERR
jgi:hypothetical protein